MENHTAKHFALQLGSLISLYVSVSFLLVLVFGVINLLFPQATESYWEIESAQSSVRLGISMLIVFFPTYIILTHTVNNLRRKEKKATYLGLTKWLIYLSLLLGGAVLLIDLVVVIMTFLEGEITERFIFKALAVLIAVGFAFFYYIKDAQGYWLSHANHSIYFGVLATAIVGVALIFGAMNIETPSTVREQKIDSAQIQDLQNIQWRIQDYLTINEALPESLSALSNSENLPEAPEGRMQYHYELTDAGFNLCAEFYSSTPTDEFFAYPRTLGEEKFIILNPDNWEHGTGEVCFERRVSF